VPRCWPEDTWSCVMPFIKGFEEFHLGVTINALGGMWFRSDPDFGVHGGACRAAFGIEVDG
jgi:hypothetical protein